MSTTVVISKIKYNINKIVFLPLLFNSFPENLRKKNNMMACKRI